MVVGSRYRSSVCAQIIMKERVFAIPPDVATVVILFWGGVELLFVVIPIAAESRKFISQIPQNLLSRFRFFKPFDCSSHIGNMYV